MSTAWETLEPWEKAAQWMESAPELATDVVAIAKEVADYRRELDREEAGHRRSMELREADRRSRLDTRLWFSQILGIGVNAVSLTVLTLVILSFGQAALVPTLLITFANGGITAATLAVGNNIRRTWKGVNHE